MYYVYSGYVSPDQYTAEDGPLYDIKEFRHSEDVLKFRLAFEDDIHDECSNVIFRVIEGRELSLTTKEIVTEYQFK